ncbi:MAG: type I-D CRISPR-associated protein Cas7/Csc2 [Candidatus Thorarchaeota archaeon]|nr:type I-D CRISPR-associated protein Cas7/Csc2 [Candidatus Thorarchaeota archaeon]
MPAKTGIPSSFRRLEPYLAEEISPLLDAKVVQVLLLRQTHDYTIFRTEESRELNTVVVPESIVSTKPVVKVAFLASKQKAPESRMFTRLLRTVDKNNECHLKDELCMKCPRCALFGAVSVKGREYNIKHRIEYSTAYSIEAYEDLLESITFNAVDEASQLTGQALNLSHNVRPLANFPSVVTLNSATWYELAMYLKTLLATKSYGAETRTKGDMRNVVLGIVAGYEEVITSLEYCLELSAVWEKETDLESVTERVLRKYAQLSASRGNLVVLTADETKKLLAEVQDVPLDADFVGAMQKHVDAFVVKATPKEKAKKGKK